MKIIKFDEYDESLFTRNKPRRRGIDRFDKPKKLDKDKDISKLVLYVFESYINGQKKQARNECEEIKSLYEPEQIYNGLYQSYQHFQPNLDEFLKMSYFVGFSRIQIQNAFYDNDDMENFSKI